MQKPVAASTKASGLSWPALAHEIAHTVQSEGNVRASFGAPMAIGKHTVVPVAAITIGVGGGMGTVRGLANRIMPLGGGGGVNIQVTPLGYLTEQGGRVVFEALPK